ncbi:hypothetical protein HCA69_12560 [Listeria grandensis]|uniref:Uncharacterized protein n=1 Tax=Listeria grandensis TaxID=1494963 RepID=A0A7X0Y584_9LIST|nr:hypothetical protein [Listeria grandensis]MBC1937205.1 hypothetical protein [Listeria grandensis]
MKGSQKQVEWALEIKEVVDTHVNTLNTNFLAQLEKDAPEDKLTSYLSRWNETGLTALTSDDSKFYIDNFKEVLNATEGTALSIVFYYGLNNAVTSLPAKRANIWVDAYNKAQKNEELLFNK